MPLCLCRSIDMLQIQMFIIVFRLSSSSSSSSSSSLAFYTNVHIHQILHILIVLMNADVHNWNEFVVVVEKKWVGLCLLGIAYISIPLVGWLDGWLVDE